MFVGNRSCGRGDRKFLFVSCFCENLRPRDQGWYIFVGGSPFTLSNHCAIFDAYRSLVVEDLTYLFPHATSRDYTIKLTCDIKWTCQYLCCRKRRRDNNVKWNFLATLQEALLNQKMKLHKRFQWCSTYLCTSINPDKCKSQLLVNLSFT